jgi:hypothetical protein
MVDCGAHDTHRCADVDEWMCLFVCVCGKRNCVPHCVWMFVYAQFVTADLSVSLLLCLCLCLCSFSPASASISVPSLLPPFHLAPLLRTFGDNSEVGKTEWSVVIRSAHINTSSCVSGRPV